MSGFLIFISGLVIGSFLNLCIYRLPRRESIIHNPSHCPACGRKLRIWDLAPLFSYLFLRGRCRYCGIEIGSRYPVVELLTGLLFLITFLSKDLNILLLKDLILYSLLIIIIFIDLEHQIIPNRLVGLFFAWSFLWQIFLPELTWRNALGGTALGGGVLLVIALVSKGGMGGGDVKLMAAAGLYLGTSMTALALFTGFLAGALTGIILILLRLKTRKDYIPFGPFLALGIILASLWGEEIIRSYLKISGLE